jgi:hypothetical protein
MQTQHAVRVETTHSQTTQLPHRNYEVAALRADGSIGLNTFKSAAFPIVDAAFSAFAQGSLLATVDGPVAIEDLQPGDTLRTTAGQDADIVWIGSSSYAPSFQSGRAPLVRIMADTFGPGRPESFITVGPAARILQTPPHLRAFADGSPLLTPARDFVDGLNVIEVQPPTPVRLFHICLTRHAAIDVGGIAMETFHPGHALVRSSTHAQRDFFLNMFPRISHMSDFGPLAHPRAPEPASN